MRRALRALSTAFARIRCRPGRARVGRDRPQIAELTPAVPERPTSPRARAAGRVAGRGGARARRRGPVHTGARARRRGPVHTGARCRCRTGSDDGPLWTLP
jgi:hypothetical protein